MENLTNYEKQCINNLNPRHNTFGDEWVAILDNVVQYGRRRATYVSKAICKRYVGENILNSYSSYLYKNNQNLYRKFYTEVEPNFDTKKIREELERIGRLKYIQVKDLIK